CRSLSSVMLPQSSTMPFSTMGLTYTRGICAHPCRSNSASSSFRMFSSSSVLGCTSGKRLPRACSRLARLMMPYDLPPANDRNALDPTALHQFHDLLNRSLFAHGERLAGHKLFDFAAMRAGVFIR